MANDIDRTAAMVRALFAIVAEFEAMFPGRRFTPDGHLVGSLGEAIAESRYGLRLLPCSTPGHDAICNQTNRRVQVKATQVNRVAFYSEPEYLIVLAFDRDGAFREIYNGPGSVVWPHVSGVGKNGQHQISVKRLQQLASSVPVHERIALATP
jgi:hypothetical protein